MAADHLTPCLSYPRDARSAISHPHASHAIPRLLTCLSPSSPLLFSPLLLFSMSVSAAPQDASHDGERDVARVAYADMLLDHDRNDCYLRAIEKEVRRLLRRLPGTITVVDVGSGAGLLSLIAARVGGNRVRVRAYEAVEAIAQCARKVVAANGLSCVIEVTSGRGEYMRIEDPRERADLLVTELFDTELIGEAALPVYRSALTHLCKTPCLAVPARGCIKVQLLKSRTLTHFHRLSPPSVLDDDGRPVALTIPQDCLLCLGSSQLHDFQVSQLRPGVDFEFCSDPVTVFEFSFNDRDSLVPEDLVSKEIQLLDDTRFSELVILFWWELLMDSEGEFVISTRPSFPQSCEEELRHAWREHWLPALYYPRWSVDESRTASQTVQLHASRDEFSFCFSLDPISSHRLAYCSCGIHSSISRSRHLLLNNFEFYERQLQVVCKAVCRLQSCGVKITSFVYVGSASHLPLLVAKKFDGRPVWCASDASGDLFFQKMSHQNQIDVRPLSLCSSVDWGTAFLLAEPFSQFADLPTDEIGLFQDASLDLTCVSPDRSLVNRAVVKCLAVEPNHLWKTHADVGPSVLGFDMRAFDELIRSASHKADRSVESSPLWEYPCKSLSDSATLLFEVDWRSLTRASRHQVTGCLPPPCEPAPHLAVCLWVDWYHDAELVCSSGPEGQLVAGGYVQWPRGRRQGVCLVREAEERTHLRFSCELRTRPLERRLTSASEVSSSASDASSLDFRFLA